MKRALTTLSIAGIALGRRLGAKVTAYYTIEGMQTVYIVGYALSQNEINEFEVRALETGQKLVDAIGRIAKAAGVPFASVVAKSLTTYEGIITVAKNRKCDAIFMASHGRRGFSRLFMGSVRQKVLSHAKMPVYR